MDAVACMCPNVEVNFYVRYSLQLYNFATSIPKLLWCNNWTEPSTNVRHNNPLLMILWYLVAWPFHICEGTCLSTTISNINCKMWILSWLLFTWKLKSQSPQKLNKFSINLLSNKMWHSRNIWTLFQILAQHGFQF